MLAFAALCDNFPCHAETVCAFLLTSCISTAYCFIKCHLFSKCNKIKAEEDIYEGRDQGDVYFTIFTNRHIFSLNQGNI